MSTFGIDTTSTRFWAKVQCGLPDECWEWKAHRDPHGYGQFAYHGTMVRSHRVIWELTHGPIPRGKGHHGMCVLHSCDNPPCVNPGHLFLGTMGDNIRDRDAKGRQRTLRGWAHPRPMAKLTPKAVRDIRSSSAPQHELATRYGVSATTICQVISRRVWAHV